MQLPQALEYFDIGARGAGLVLITWLVITVRHVRGDVQDLRTELLARVERLEALHIKGNKQHNTERKSR